MTQDGSGRILPLISYGPSPENLRYLLTYEIEPRLEIRNLTATNAQILFTGPVSRYRHKRV